MKQVGTGARKDCESWGNILNIRTYITNVQLNSPSEYLKLSVGVTVTGFDKHIPTGSVFGVERLGDVKKFH